MAIIDLHLANRVEVVPGCFARFLHSENVTIAYWEILRGSTLPEHSHPHEQIAQILEGQFEIAINGATSILPPGKVAIIPPHAIHSGQALTDCKIIDVFYPIREDYLAQSGNFVSVLSLKDG